MTGRSRTRLSAVGWGALALGLPLLVVGLWLGWAELTAAGGVAVAAVLVALATTLGRLPHRVRLDLADRRVRVGERAFGGVVVTAPQRRTRPIGLELQVGAGRAELEVPALGAGQVHEDLFAVPTHRRAVVTVGPVRAVRSDPLGLAVRHAVATGAEDLFVHPRIVLLSRADAGLLRDLEGGSTRDLSDADLAFHALRDYVVGDDRRSIHWRTTARRGVLTVKQYEDTRRTQTAVALSTDPRDYQREEDDLELAVSVLASIGVQVMAEEHPLAALAGAARVRTTTRRPFLDDCSGLATTVDGTGTAVLGRRIARDVPDVTLAFLVTGSEPDDAALRSAARHVPEGTRTLAIGCRPGLPLQVRTQRGLSLIQLGELDDLPRALRLAARS
ncbi:DUF58 domain-containing protein [Cellulomonas denverensis]|uniref:DUF58 domain-containing protein n=1 Tax=Cellulomonas denverensis TaxID=264297 RepID=A0A7X6KWV5_9CELL|nr:DUF58 domain-containing protein [Cellulomonas denverensis]NKY23699.1 DUF58 domain-containing protein [Cellulomonas denverensis]GIG26959.1 hypothetical protein Cde04nite_32030 [Cellulomonas denverensis]